MTYLHKHAQPRFARNMRSVGDRKNAHKINRLRVNPKVTPSYCGTLFALACNQSALC
jgi:hypothetical protein